MSCPHGGSPTAEEQDRRSTVGYRTFRCPTCQRRFNERTGIPWNDLRVPTEIALQVVIWRVRYTLSLRDVAEIFLQRGFRILFIRNPYVVLMAATYGRTESLAESAELSYIIDQDFRVAE